MKNYREDIITFKNEVYEIIAKDVQFHHYNTIDPIMGYKSAHHVLYVDCKNIETGKIKYIPRTYIDWYIEENEKGELLDD